MIMKRNIKKFLLPVAVVAAVSFAACSDWTETESLDMKNPSLETQNPGLYKQYLEALRTYKAGEHKVPGTGGHLTAGAAGDHAAGPPAVEE